MQNAVNQCDESLVSLTPFQEVRAVYRSLICLLCVASFAGCAFRPVVTSDAVSFNRSVETTQNRTLFMNVLRASERKPLYFTELAKITGTISARLGADITLPFDGLLDTYSVKPSGSIQGGPTYDVLSLSTKEFMNGILTPTSPALFKYYWEQGWARDLLLYMFVREVRLPDGTSVFVNQPGDKTAMHEFAGFVECVVAGRPSLTAQEVWRPVSKDLASVAAADAVEAQKSRLRFSRNDNGRYDLEAPALSVQLEFSCQQDSNNPKIAGAAKSVPEQLRSAGNAPVAQKLDFVSQALVGLARSPGPGGTPRDYSVSLRDLVGKPGDTQEQVELVLRSPEAMIYYLGELTREQLRDNPANPPVVEAPDGENAVGTNSQLSVSGAATWPLFVVRTGASGRDAVSVGRGGSRFYIPSGAEGGRSMNCFSLIVQIFGLHKSRDTLPTTQTVIGIGPIP